MEWIRLVVRVCAAAGGRVSVKRTEGMARKAEVEEARHERESKDDDKIQEPDEGGLVPICGACSPAAAGGGGHGGGGSFENESQPAQRESNVGHGECNARPCQWIQHDIYDPE